MSPRDRFRSKSITLSLLVLCLAIGCESESETPVVDPAANPPATSANIPVSENPAPAPTSGNLRVGPDGRKMLVDIPLEVWIDDPLGVVAQQGTVPQNTMAQNAAPTVDPGTTPKPTETTTPEPTTPETPMVGAVNWGEIIPMPILDAEVKAIQNMLAGSMQNVGSYNASQGEIPPMIPLQTHTLAALALIAEQHPETTLWKGQAPALRELALTMRSNAEGLGRKPFEATQIEFEKMQRVFSGSKADLAEEPVPNAPVGDKVEMFQLMHRMQKSYNWLSSNTPTASALKEAKEKATHELMILNALLNVIADPSYVISEEEDYQNFFRATIENVNGMREGIETDNFDLFKTNVGEIYGKCSACHNAYKGN